MANFVVPFGVWVPFINTTRPPNHEEWDDKVMQRRNISQTEAGLWTGEERMLTRQQWTAEREKELERKATREEIALAEARAITTSYELERALEEAE